jgi:serine/threonine protein kinase
MGKGMLLVSFIDSYDDGSWRVESKIGEGAYGKVYKIVKEEFGYQYSAALKVIPVPRNSAEIMQLKAEGLDSKSIHTYIEGMVGDILGEIKFVQEFRGTSNIVNYEDHKIISKEGEEGVNILLRMELLESLGNIASVRKLEEDEIIKIGIDICQALVLLHKYDTIHRDIKPDNILLSRHGDFKLGDFGIARKIDRSASAMSQKGTFTFMAPEVYWGNEYGTSVDLYSLGMVIYRLLNGNRIPFMSSRSKAVTHEDREAAIMKRMRGEKLPPPEFANRELALIVLKACEHDMNIRFQLAQDMKAAFEEYQRYKRLGIPRPWPVIKPIQDPIDPDMTQVLGRTPPIPDPKPDPIPKPDPKPDLKPIPQPDPKPVPKPDPKPKPAPVPCIVIRGQRFKETEKNVELFSMKLRDKDLELLGKLPELSSLYLDSNDITDLAPLAKLSKLSKLSLLQNRVVSLKPLAEMPSLKSLNAGYNSISDLHPISELKGLVYLHICNNSIRDTSPLAGLKNLSYLNLDCNKICDIGALAGLDKLVSLYLCGNQITNLNPLSKLEALTELYLDSNQLYDIRPLMRLKNLTKLSLQNTLLVDPGPLAKLPKLKHLQLHGEFGDMSKVRELKDAMPDCTISV